MSERLRFICSECGAISGCEAESLDNGTTLLCDECGKATVVRLVRASVMVRVGVLHGTPLCHGPGRCLSCVDPRGNPALRN